MVDEKDLPKEDVPTNYLLLKTRSKFPWALVVVIAVLAGVAGGLLWYFVGGQ